MKKFALAAIAAAALTGGVAQAYTVGTFSNGVVVPNVVHNGTQSTTAVGLINRAPITVPVFWTFFDQNSVHVTDGCFGMTANQYKGFNWADEAGMSLENARGYLVFAVGTSTAGAAAATVCGAPGATTLAPSAGQLSANAFYVDLANKDVAFTPVIDGPLSVAANTNLTTMDANSLVSVAGAAAVGTGATNPANTTLNMRYFIGNGNTTRIAVWSTGDQRGTHTVNMYDNAQNRKSVNFELKEAEMSWFDPETIAGRPAGYVDGFITWNAAVVPSARPATLPVEKTLAGNPAGGSVFSYSVVSSPAFGAVQSLLGAHSAR